MINVDDEDDENADDADATEEFPSHRKMARRARRLLRTRRCFGLGVGRPPAHPRQALLEGVEPRGAPPRCAERADNFAVEPRTRQWQFFDGAWNDAQRTLRASDLISDSELDDLLFRFIGGREACEDFFGVPEYVIYPTMVSSTVFTTQVVRGQYSTSYPSFSRTLRQARDLGVWLRRRQLGLVERSVRQELLLTLTKLAVHEAHLRRTRRRGDAGGFSSKLRGALTQLLTVLRDFHVQLSDGAEEPRRSSRWTRRPRGTPCRRRSRASRRRARPTASTRGPPAASFGAGLAPVDESSSAREAAPKPRVSSRSRRAARSRRLRRRASLGGEGAPLGGAPPLGLRGRRGFGLGPESARVGPLGGGTIAARASLVNLYNRDSDDSAMGMEEANVLAPDDGDDLDAAREMLEALKLLFTGAAQREHGESVAISSEAQRVVEEYRKLRRLVRIELLAEESTARKLRQKLAQPATGTVLAALLSAVTAVNPGGEPRRARRGAS